MKHQLNQLIGRILNMKNNKNIIKNKLILKKYYLRKYPQMNIEILLLILKI